MARRCKTAFEGPSALGVRTSTGKPLPRVPGHGTNEASHQAARDGPWSAIVVGRVSWSGARVMPTHEGSTMTWLLGIDCSTSPRKTGLALGELRGETVAITRCTRGSKAQPPAAIAAEWLRDCDEVVIAMDSPLGWPMDLAPSLGSHRAGMVIAVEANRLFRRITDDEIKRRLGKRPLDVGADRIARTAVAALKLLDEMRRDAGRAIPLAWAPVEAEPWRLIEVYPAATRIAHGSKGKGGSIEGLDKLLDCSAVLDIVRESVDAADACVCALAAADFRLDRAVPPLDQETAETEGWIWAPDAQSESSGPPASASRNQHAVARVGAAKVATIPEESADGGRARTRMCVACQKGLPPDPPRRCPECGYVFAGRGWGGIDAHWKARHTDVMSYADFWTSLCPAHGGR